MLISNHHFQSHVRSFNYIPIFPIIWAAFCAINIISNYRYYMMTQEGRVLLALFAIMMVLCAFLAIYLIKPRFLMKILQKVSPGRRCPNCYERVEKGSHFCAKCGTIIDDSSECTVMAKCGRCGERISDSAVDFCPRCGNLLKK